MKILIIEDEKELRRSVVTYLSHEGYICESAGNYKEAIEKLNDYEYDCILVDIMLPDGNGLEIVRFIKKKEINSGVIIVSANNSLDDRVEGLELGSDDYLTKPFHLSELNARVKSVLRRRNFQGSKDIVFNEIHINPDSRQVFVNKNEVIMTGKEFDLLVFFIANKARVIPKDSIAEHLWGDHMDQANSYDFLYTHIKNMRKKLIQSGCKDYLSTVYGIGYKFQE